MGGPMRAAAHLGTRLGCSEASWPANLGDSGSLSRNSRGTSPRTVSANKLQRKGGISHTRSKARSTVGPRFSSFNVLVRERMSVFTSNRRV
jgi:hypothetical protein